MATKSILKNVDVKDKSMGTSLVRALESAKKRKGKDTSLSRSYSEVNRSNIKEFFGKK